MSKYDGVPLSGGLLGPASAFIVCNALAGVARASDVGISLGGPGSLLVTLLSTAFAFIVAWLALTYMWALSIGWCLRRLGRQGDQLVEWGLGSAFAAVLVAIGHETLLSKVARPISKAALAALNALSA